MNSTNRVPVTVIENEFGKVGVDQDLVITAEEELSEMNTGCICCRVRGDLIRILTHNTVVDEPPLYVGGLTIDRAKLTEGFRSCLA